MMLDPRVVNLNTGSFGPQPRVVLEEATRLRRRLAEEPMDFLVRQAPPLLWQARQRLADFIQGDPHRLVFTANVSVAINIVAATLSLAEPGEILLTDHEYGAMQWCWERAAQRQGLTLRTFALPVLPRHQGDVVQAACDAFSDRTRLFFFSHVLSPTGMVLPARELCMEARQRGITTVVDGAHAPAMIPLDVTGLGCDFYAGNCHKWLLAPIGSGFLYLSPGAEERIQPLQVSWGWHYERSAADEADEFGSTPRLRALEFEGTRDCCSWLAIPAAIDFQARLGWDRIRARNLRLAGFVREQLGGRLGLPNATPPHPELHGFMTAFRLPVGTDPAALRRALWDRFRIEAPVIDRPAGARILNAATATEEILPAHSLVRASTHFYNMEEEIVLLADAIEVLLPCCRST
jgi:isopenicillin-N epimerase